MYFYEDLDSNNDKIIPIITTKIARIMFLLSIILNDAFFSLELAYLSPSTGRSTSTVFFISGSAY